MPGGQPFTKQTAFTSAEVQNQRQTEEGFNSSGHLHDGLDSLGKDGKCSATRFS